jgi:hypothetical protein
MRVVLLMFLLAGCAFAKEEISPRQITCRAECTPDMQYIECEGLSEGTISHDMELKQ